MLRQLVDRVRNTGEKRQHLEEDGDRVRHVAVAHVDRRQAEHEPEHGDGGEQEERGRQQYLGAAGPLVEDEHHPEQHDEAEHEVDDRA